MTHSLNIALLTFTIGLLNAMVCNAQNTELIGHGEKILVIGSKAKTLEIFTGILHQHNYKVKSTLLNDDTINAFKSDTCDAVIIGGGVDAASRIMFHAEFPKINPAVKVIDAKPATVLTSLKKAFPDKPK
jgi:DNA-binding NtrC family response regulator